MTHRALTTPVTVEVDRNTLIDRAFDSTTNPGKNLAHALVEAATLEWDLEHWDEFELPAAIERIEGCLQHLEAAIWELAREHKI